MKQVRTGLFLSVIVPLYNEELVIDEMYQRIKKILDDNQINYEIILINDGSKDDTLPKANLLCQNDVNVKLISFSRNFGHQVAITAGMDNASGQCVVIIDADLQDPPEVIIQMIEKWKEGYHVVYGVRKKRQGETSFKLFTASVYYRILKKLTSVEIPVDAGDFRLMDRKVVDELIKMRERNRFVRGMVSWVGFKQCEIEYEREKRYAGETKYPFKKMLKFATDGIISFSHVPLKLSSTLGFISAAASMILMIWGLIVKVIYPEVTITGWASLFVSVLFIGGIQLLCIGILGEYLGRIYDEIKKRPIYIIDEQINFNSLD